MANRKGKETRLRTRAGRWALHGRPGHRPLLHGRLRRGSVLVRAARARVRLRAGVGGGGEAARHVTFASTRPGSATGRLRSAGGRLGCRRRGHSACQAAARCSRGPPPRRPLGEARWSPPPGSPMGGEAATAAAE